VIIFRLFVFLLALVCVGCYFLGQVVGSLYICLFQFVLIPLYILLDFLCMTCRHILYTLYILSLFLKFLNVYLCGICIFR
jgi:hypothetical protein